MLSLASSQYLFIFIISRVKIPYLYTNVKNIRHSLKILIKPQFLRVSIKFKRMPEDTLFWNSRTSWISLGRFLDLTSNGLGTSFFKPYSGFNGWICLLNICRWILDIWLFNSFEKRYKDPHQCCEMTKVSFTYFTHNVV